MKRNSIYEYILLLRRANNVHKPVQYSDWLQDKVDNHARYMAENNKCLHAPVEYLDGAAECIAYCDFYHPIVLQKDIISFLVFDCLASNENHRNFLLNASTVAGSIERSHHAFYLCIRGYF